jgi:hypothetical protein
MEGVGWHTFRHGYRGLLDETGAPIGVQQRLMRHAQVSTTMNIYGNAAIKSKRNANSKVVERILLQDEQCPQPRARPELLFYIVGFCGVFEKHRLS